MTLPSLKKIWTVSGNQAIAGTGNVINDRKALFLGIKNKFLSAPMPWVVSASCNATATITGSDNLTSIGSIVNAADGTAHSWIVLQQSQISPTFQICFEFSSATQSSMTIVVSPVTGFSSGSTTRRPRAPDEYIILSSSTWFDFVNYVSSSDIVYDTWFSNDGRCNRVVALWQNNSRGMWMFDKVEDAPYQWQEKSIFFVLSGRGEPTSGSLLFETPRVLGSVNQMYCTLFMAAEGTRQGTVHKLTPITSSFNGKYPLLPITLCCSTWGRRGVLGSVADMWYGPELKTLITGTTYPESGSAQFVQLGNLVHVWNVDRNVRIG